MTIETSPPRSPWPRLLLVVGIVVYVAAQGFLTVSPLLNWNLTPEVDDTLTYVLKAQQMAECFSQTCPALVDLRQELFAPVAAPEANRQRLLAMSKVFPVYHPLFSAVLVGLGKLGMSLMTAYRLLWSLAPLIFGLAFAYLLAVLFGPGPAGAALILLAFKVFPDTGLHHLVPSNLTMALAVVLWARIISRQGRAPWSLLLGSLVLMAMHLLGVIYAFMAAMLALLAAPPAERRRLLLAVLGVAGVMVAFFLFLKFWRHPPLVTPPLFPRGEAPLSQWMWGSMANLAQVVTENVKFAGGLWGSMPLFLGALVLGGVTLGNDRRRVVGRFLLLYALVFVGLLFYVSDHPADVLFRIWIPLVVVLFGLVGQAIWHTVELSLAWRQKRRATSGAAGGRSPGDFWPVVALAVLLGYAGETILRGGEQMAIMAAHLRARQPLALRPEQPAKLLSHSQPGDRVLYTSVILMPYYFIYGAMRLGAVYYHPSFQGTPLAHGLTRPEVRFAVAYNPTVYHPSFAGVDEHRWWVTTPELHYSPLSRGRRHQPVAREGKIPVELYRWVELRPQSPPGAARLRLLLDNPGPAAGLEVVPLNQTGAPQARQGLTVQVPARWSGWLSVDLSPLPPWSALRLVFPRGKDSYSLSGLTLGESGHLWPWDQKVQAAFFPRGGDPEPFTLSFDPADLLPGPLRGRQVTVLDDRGSAVLLELQP